MAALERSHYIHGFAGVYTPQTLRGGHQRNYTRALDETGIGHNTIAGGGQVADDTHTFVEWLMQHNTAAQGQVAAWVDDYQGGIRPGDILCVSATGQLTRAMLTPDREGEDWVRITEVVASLLQNGQNSHAFRLTHDTWAQGPPPAHRRVFIIPALYIQNWQMVRRWKLGDLCSFSNSALVPSKVIALNDPIKRLIFQAPLIGTGEPVLYPSATIPVGGAVVNKYAAYGGMSVFTGNAEGGRDINNTWLHNNNPVPFSALNAGGPGDAGSRSEQIRKLVQIDYLPRDMNLSAGDVINIAPIQEAPMKPDGTRQSSYTGQFVVLKGGDPISRTRYDDVGQTWPEMQATEMSNVGFDLTKYANGEPTGYAVGSDAYGRVANGGGADVLTQHVHENNQTLHVGGRVSISHDSCREIELPVAHITAKYRKTPYVEAIAVEMHEGAMKEKYHYPYMEKEIYREVQAMNYPTKKSFTVRMPQITLLQGFSNLFIYAPLAPKSRRCEFYTGFSDQYFDITEVQVRVNEKMCILGTEPESWFYDEFCRVSEKEYTFEQWKQRKIIALTPESLQFPGLFEGAKRLYNLSITFTVQLSADQEVMCANAATMFNSLCVGSTHIKHQQRLVSAEGQDFIKRLQAEGRVVVEYTRKKVSLESSGDVKIDHQMIPTQQPDGLTLRGKTQQTVMRSGGNPTAFLQTF